MTTDTPTTVSLSRKIGVTTFALVLIALFGTALNWQLQRALSGNALSWAYVVEWPVFIGYTIYFWWKDIHGERPGMKSARREARAAAKARNAGESNAQADAYNRYLHDLHTWEQRQHRS